MTVRHVADLLALAHEGLIQAEAANDEGMRKMAKQIAIKALSHPDAGAFFGGIQLALAEVHEKPYGNDPDIDDNDEGVMDPESDADEDVDEDSPAASPVYEGVTDGDEDEDSEKDDVDKPKDQNPEAANLVIAAALANLRKF